MLLDSAAQHPALADLLVGSRQRQLRRRVAAVFHLSPHNVSFAFGWLEVPL
jgi:hypothetical protein